MKETERKKQEFLWNKILLRYCFGDWNCLTDTWRWKHIQNGGIAFDNCKCRDECKTYYYKEINVLERTQGCRKKIRYSGGKKRNQ